MTATLLLPNEVERESPAAQALVSAELLQIEASGMLSIQLAGGERHEVAWLESAASMGIVLQPGDRLLVALDAGVALGRIGRYQPPRVSPVVTIEATEQLSLKCGESRIDLRADGKLMVRGEDVLLRAKNTQRIRAGTVAIN